MKYMFIALVIFTLPVLGADTDPLTLGHAKELMKWFGALISFFFGVSHGMEVLKL